MELKILIAEDEPRLREVLCDYFLSKGDFPTAAPDGLTALELACEKEFDGVLLDIMMPGLDGLSVCRALRKRSDVPIISSPPCPMKRTSCWIMNLGPMIT